MLCMHTRIGISAAGKDKNQQSEGEQEKKTASTLSGNSLPTCAACIEAW